MSSADCSDLCRLCLVKERVTVPIFEGEGDARRIFTKISTCLPVKISREDKLPQKLCADCVYKVETFFEFWQTTAVSEKRLQAWLADVEKQDYAVATVLNQSGMKGEQSNENRLDGSGMMQQVSGHQNSLNMVMDNMGMCMSMMMPNNQQQITSVPMDPSGSSVQSIQVVAGSSTHEQITHDQIIQNQTNAPTQQEEEEESSEDEENSDDECDGDGLPIKEESEEDPNNSRTIEPTTFVNVSLACEDPGPSGLQQQKMADIQEMTTAGDPKTGDSPADPLNVTDVNNLEHYVVESIECTPEYDSLPGRKKRHITRKGKLSSAPRQKDHCSKKIPRGQTLHQDKNERKKPLLSLECATCGKRFGQKSTMIKHMNQHKYQCQTCCQSFSLKRDLKRHVEKAHGPLLYPCSICEYKSNNKCTLKDHFIRKHTTSFQYSCTVCSKQFKIKNDLKQHMNQMHSGEPPIICSICGHACKNVPAIKAHMKYRHYKPAYECKICKRGLTTQEYLDQHLIWHERKEKVICPTCGKTFGQKRDLDLHLRIHQGIRPFSCPVCAKTFPRKTAQEQHMLIHTGKRPYICDICGQTFAQKPGLICHRKRHPGPLPPLPVVSIKKIIMDFTQELGVPAAQQQDKITLDN
ncbi:zinc finger protein 570-like isoform X15 [Harpegnathos saltator]|uniref:zinc finger protein 570-like isoform X15 n=1 Tax=Harpegnathos saltator TaxID=610380 RepID=UPI000DBEE87A|nr:zinc finger protein 570-like isoform X15 [Harpegnathos saltator]